MRTREQIEAEVRGDNPVSDGNTSGDPKYEALITKWTSAKYESELEQDSIPKSWASSHEFLNELTNAEINDLANDSTVAGLALLLASWQSNVVINDPRIESGLAALVAVGILTEARVEEIASTSTKTYTPD